MELFKKGIVEMYDEVKTSILGSRGGVYIS